MLEKLPESVGNILLGQRAGIESVTFNKLLFSRPMVQLEILSTAFKNLHRIPVMYTADGNGISPPLEWYRVPAFADRVVLIVEDADSPTPQPLVHAIAVFEGSNGSVETGALASPHHEGAGVATGINSFLRHAWLPPDPPPGHGEHRYVFQIFALKDSPDFSSGLGRGELTEAVMTHAVAAGFIVGIYSREQKIDDAIEMAVSGSELITN